MLRKGQKKAPNERPELSFMSVKNVISVQGIASVSWKRTAKF